MTRRAPATVVVMVMMVGVALADGQAGTTDKKRERPAAPTNRIGDDLLAALTAMAQYRSQFTGLQHSVGDKTQLSVTTGRVQLGWNIANAKSAGGRYAPPESARSDTLLILCGDNDLGEIFECARVILKTAAGVVVKPISYRAGPSAYTNAMGAKWRVRDVAASYPIAGLVDGFSIGYSDFIGTEWTFVVSDSQAFNNLRLGLQPATK